MGVRSEGKALSSRNLQGISDIFDTLKIAKAVKSHLRNIDLWTRWNEIVGPELSKVTAPKDIKSKSLTITVAHQAWAHQLHFLSPSILNKIRAVCPEIEVKDLHFVVGTVKPMDRFIPANSKLENADSIVGPAPLTERQEMTLRAVADDRLRSTIRKAMEASVRWKK